MLLYDFLTCAVVFGLCDFVVIVLIPYYYSCLTAYVLRCATLPGWDNIEEAKLKKAFVNKCRARAAAKEEGIYGVSILSRSMCFSFSIYISGAFKCSQPERVLYLCVSQLLHHGSN